MALISVVLPEPFGPISPTISPAPSASETLSSARSPENSTETLAAVRELPDMEAPAEAPGGEPPGAFHRHGAGMVSGLRQPTKLGLPPLSSTSTAALLGTCPSSAVPSSRSPVSRLNWPSSRAVAPAAHSGGPRASTARATTHLLPPHH